jgi:integrase/recombinase XerD
MAHVRLRYVSHDRDRHGNMRYYFRRDGKKIRLQGLPGSEEFMAAYKAAVGGVEVKPRQCRTLAPGSFGHLCNKYYQSPIFKALDISTQSWRRRTLNGICENHGEKPVHLMQPRHIRMLRDEKSELPAAANQRLKALRALFSWALEEEEASNDPTLGVKKIKYLTGGHHTWTVEEIEAYKAIHPLGTKARLALDILRFTTGRREDAVRLGKPHLRGGRVQFRQAKNEHRNPVDIDIPLHPELAASIDACPSGHLTFLVTDYGRPYTPAGFGNAMRDWCDEANLRHCSAHGLRKATLTQIAEGGGTPHELMAVGGHRSLEEVERYTRKANKRKLATSGMEKLK